MGGVINPDYFRTGAGTGGSGLTGGGRFSIDRALMAQARAALWALVPHRERPEPVAAKAHPATPAAPPRAEPTIPLPITYSAQPSRRPLIALVVAAAALSGAWAWWRWNRAAG